MRCRIRARQCISATVDHNYEPRGVKTYAIFGSDRPCQRTFCDPRLSADPVFDRRDPLPAFADLLGLYGRGDRAAWALGGRRDGHCAALPLPSVGHLWIRSGAKILAERCAVVASVDLRPARPRGKGRGIARRGAVRHRQIPSCKTGTPWSQNSASLRTLLARSGTLTIAERFQGVSGEQGLGLQMPCRY
jgi:hypothetical protein